MRPARAPAVTAFRAIRPTISPATTIAMPTASRGSNVPICTSHAVNRGRTVPSAEVTSDSNIAVRYIIPNGPGDTGLEPL